MNRAAWTEYALIIVLVGLVTGIVCVAAGCPLP